MFFCWSLGTQVSTVPHYVLLLHCSRFAPICAGSKNGFCCSSLANKLISLRSRLSTISLVERSMQNVLMGVFMTWHALMVFEHLPHVALVSIIFMFVCSLPVCRTTHFHICKTIWYCRRPGSATAERADCASSTALVYVQILVTNPKMFHRKINCTELVAWQIRIQWLYNIYRNKIQFHDLRVWTLLSSTA